MYFEYKFIINYSNLLNHIGKSDLFKEFIEIIHSLLFFFFTKSKIDILCGFF